jgi:hypothetical protein
VSLTTADENREAIFRRVAHELVITTADEKRFTIFRRVGHECPSPPRMKIERLFSAEYLVVF